LFVDGAVKVGFYWLGAELGMPGNPDGAAAQTLDPVVPGFCLEVDYRPSGQILAAD
jgi:hypothetical protein